MNLAATIIFPCVQGVDLGRIQFAEDSLYSSTRARDMDTILREVFILMQRYYRKTRINVIDATANVGASVIPMLLHRAINWVQTFEINEDTHRMLVSNIALYGLTKRVDIIHGDFVGHMDTIDYRNTDFIFIDPPWGGPGYKDSKNLILILGSLPLETIVQTLLRRGTI